MPCDAARPDAEEGWPLSGSIDRGAAAVVAMGGHVTSPATVRVYFGYPEVQEDAANAPFAQASPSPVSMAGLKAKVAQMHDVALPSASAFIPARRWWSPLAAARRPRIPGSADDHRAVEASAAPDNVVMTDAVHDLVSGLFAMRPGGAPERAETRPSCTASCGPAGQRWTRGFGPLDMTPFVAR